MPSSASMPDQRASRSARPLLALDDDDPDCQRPGFEVRHLDIPLGTTQNHRHHHHHQHNNDINNNSRRHHRPSLDSTYSEPSELSIDSGHVREVHHPLLLPPPPPSSAPSLDNNLVWRIFSPLSAAASWRPSRWGSVRIRGLIDSFWLRNKGVVLVLLAMVFGSGMNVAARLMETAGSHGKAMHPFQILFARMSITVLLSLFYGFYTRIPHFPLGSREVRVLLIVRGVGGFFGVFGLYWSLLYLPLAEATVLTFLAPILTCYACSRLIQGETFTRQQQVAGFLSLVGVVFIARPARFFGGSSLSSSSSSCCSSSSHHSNGSHGIGPSSSMHANTTSSSLCASAPVSATLPSTGTSSVPTQHQHLLAVLFAMIGVLGATTAMTSIRKIGTRAHPLISVNYFSSWCTLVSLVAVLAVPSVGFRLPGNVQEWGLLALLGVFGFVMQFLLTAGLAYGGPGSSSAAAAASGPMRHSDPDIEIADRGGKRAHPAATDACADEEDTSEARRSTGWPAKTTAATSTTSTASATKGSGTRATSMLYTQMLFALAFDRWIWGLSPGWSSWVGSVIILGCAAWVAGARDMQKKDEVGREEEEEEEEEEEGLGPCFAASSVSGQRQ